jgi:hypothetical protein
MMIAIVIIIALVAFLLGVGAGIVGIFEVARREGCPLQCGAACGVHDHDDYHEGAMICTECLRSAR